MEFVTVSVPDNFNIFFLGDVHIGTLLFHEDGFKQALDMTTRTYRGCSCTHIIGMGDYVEAIDTSDKRFDVFTANLGLIRPDLQYEHLHDLIKPYRKKFDTLLFGNHDFTLLKYADHVRRICNDFNIAYGTYSSVVTYVNKKDELLFKVYATHGNGSIKSCADDPERIEANMNLSLKRKLKNKVGDCAIEAMGHTHNLLVLKPKKTLYMTSDENGLKQAYKLGEQSAPYIHPDHRYYLNTGSFRRTFARGVSDYAERAGYDPVVLGFPVITVRGGKIVDAFKEYV